MRRRALAPRARIGAADGLGGMTILDDEAKGILRVVDDLLVFEQVEKAVIRDVFERLHSAAEKKHGQGDQTEGDREENHAAPIKIGVVAAGLILPLRVPVRLWHRKKFYNGKKLP